MRKIKILKDTPFNKEGDIIDIKEFRSKYDYICSKGTTDEELLNYILREHSHYVLHPHDKEMGQWFTITTELDKVTIDNIPLAFIHEDLYYTKEFGSGIYHVWSSPSQKALQSPFRIISINKALELLNSAKFKQEILYCTDYRNKQL